MHPRDVWTDEKTDLNPWIAERLDGLSNLTGMVPESVAVEKNLTARGFSGRCDILVTSEAGERYVVECQRDPANPDHRNRLKHYCEGFGAEHAVWIAPTFGERLNPQWWRDKGLDVSFVQLGAQKAESGGIRAAFTLKGATREGAPVGTSVTLLVDDRSPDKAVDDPGVVKLKDGTLKRRMTVYLDPDDGKKVKVLAALEDRKISDVLAEAVESYLDGRELPDF